MINTSINTFMTVSLIDIEFFVYILLIINDMEGDYQINIIFLCNLIL